jgi:hypothetical protein
MLLQKLRLWLYPQALGKNDTLKDPLSKLTHLCLVAIKPTKLRRQIMDMKSSKPFGERVDVLRELLDLSHPDFDGISGMAASKVRIRFKRV